MRRMHVAAILTVVSLTVPMTCVVLSTARAGSSIPTAPNGATPTRVERRTTWPVGRSGFLRSEGAERYTIIVFWRSAPRLPDLQ
jgi:hypothetical protein